MSDFGYYLGRTVEELVTSQGDIKNRLGLAINNYLLLANAPEDPSVPAYFRDKHARILDKLSKKSLIEGEKIDSIRATIQPMWGKTAAKYAQQIWDLYIEFQEYERSGFIPTVD